MKKLLIFVIAATSFTSSFAQETKSSEKPERIKVVKAGEPDKVKKSSSIEKQSPAEELRSCEAQLKAIEVKEGFLNEHPAELKIAKENGWFTAAEKNKAVLLKRIKELKIELKK